MQSTFALSNTRCDHTLYVPHTSSDFLSFPSSSWTPSSFSVIHNWKSSGPGVSMIMYSLLFDFLMGFHLIIITWFLRCVLKRELRKTKGGQIWRCWHMAWSALVSPSACFCMMINFPLEHDVNMLMCLPLLRYHPTDNKSCCVLPT